MPVSIATPLTLGTRYTDAATVGPFQEIDELVFQNTGGPLIFEFGVLDPTGAVRFDNQEIVYPPGTWAFRNLQGIRFRSNQGSAAATLQAATAFFKDDPEPFNPGNVPGSVSLTSTLNFQHNDILVASEPTIDFEDGSPIVWNVTDDNANSRVKVTPVFNNAADKSSASAQVFTGPLSTGPLASATYTVAGVFLDTVGAIYSVLPGGTGSLAVAQVGDTAARFVVFSDHIEWGPGNAGRDTTFGRLAAGVAGTSADAISTAPLTNGRATQGCFLDPAGRFLATVNAVTNATLASAVVGDTGWRISLDLNRGPSSNMPGIVFGTGAGGGDTEWFRGTAGAPSGTAIGWQTGSRVTTTSTTGFNTVSAVNNSALQSWLLATDTQPAFKIFQQGAMTWGPGGSTVADIEIARIVNLPGGTGSFLELINGDGFGFGAGCGGSVTQLTNKGTGVTLSKPVGRIIMNNASLAGGASVTFILTNTTIGPADTLSCNSLSLVGLGVYLVQCVQIQSGGGAALIQVTNIGTTASEAVNINFIVHKGSTT
jgi:hypothetical protein